VKTFPILTLFLLKIPILGAQNTHASSLAQENKSILFIIIMKNNSKKEKMNIIFQAWGK